jgi:hypothetical protein
MKKILPLIVLGCTLGIASADVVINFTGLNSADGIGSNTLQVNGSSTDLTVARTLVSGDYLYAIGYTGADFDGDTVNDTLNFTVRVNAKRNGAVVYGATANTSTATIGGNNTDVMLSTGAANLNAWNTGSDVIVADGSMIFTVEGASVSTGQGVDPVSFSGVFMEEARSRDHKTVIGAGSGLPGYLYHADKAISVSPGISTLFVSNGAGANDAVGVRDVDFSVTVIPEPATLGLVAAFGGGLLFIRRVLQL